MATEISLSELRTDTRRIVRSLSAGETFAIISNGEPVGELTPLRRRRFVSAVSVIEMFRGAPEVDAARFREDLDDHVDQDIEPRG
jgi:antitoxin (DNA-binding transcriptional repressor) of toxin-antitoxin stability system